MVMKEMTLFLEETIIKYSTEKMLCFLLLTLNVSEKNFKLSIGRMQILQNVNKS